MTGLFPSTQYMSKYHVTQPTADTQRNALEFQKKEDNGRIAGRSRSNEWLLQPPWAAQP